MKNRSDTCICPKYFLKCVDKKNAFKSTQVPHKSGNLAILPLLVASTYIYSNKESKCSISIVVIGFEFINIHFI